MTARFRIKPEKRQRLVFRSISVTLNITVSIEREEERCPYKKFVHKKTQKGYQEK